MNVVGFNSAGLTAVSIADTPRRVSKFRLQSILQPGRSRSNADSELVERCLREDDSAWEELVSRHTRRVYRLCYRFTGRHSVAEELTQDVFLRVFRTLGSFRAEEASLASWLTRLTRNLLIDYYRRTRDDRVTWSIEEHPAIEERFASTMELPDRAVAGREASELLQSMLSMLSPELREPILFYDVEEMSYRDIAHLVGVPVGTVKSRLNRGRAEMARLIRIRRIAA